MRILSLDTATRSCSVAVLDDKRLMAEITTLRSQTHSVHLLKMIDQVLQTAGVDLDTVDGFAVTRGPGSFTGLRIGIGTVKGLVETSGKPLAAVSSLRVLAGQVAGDQRLICPILDARKSEVYFTRFRYRKGRLDRLAGIQVASIEKAIGDIDEPCLFVGDGAMLHRDVICDTVGRYAFFAPASQQILRASTLAFLSLEKFIRQETENIETFVPCYIRKSDAELNRVKPAVTS